MRLSFRVKVFAFLSLALIFVLAVAMLGILWLFDRYFDARVEAQFLETRDSIQNLQEEQRRALQPFTRAMNVPKIRIAIEEGDPKTDLRPEVDATLRLLQPPCDGLSIANRDGKFLVRARPGDDPNFPWVVETADSGQAHPEKLLIDMLAPGLPRSDGYFVSNAQLYYGLCQRLELKDEENRVEYGFVVFWNEIGKELSKVKAIHPSIRVAYLVDGSPRPFEEAVGDVRGLVEGGLNVVTIGRDSFSVLAKTLQRGPPVISRVFKFPRREKDEFAAKVATAALGIAIGALAAALVVSFFISRGIARPILTLVGATREIEQGNFGVRVGIQSRDELGLLGASFNEMAEGLAEREKRRTIMQKTLSVDVESELMKTGEMTLGGQVAEATIMFVDIRGFTPMTEGMPPEQVVAMLNEYMTMAEKVIRRNRGIVSKFIGDGILALFGVPKSYGDDVLNAVRAGRELISELGTLNETRRGRGEKEIRIGVGINTGEVLKGNVGSESRLEFTVIGEQVNLASRLCSNAKPMQVLISESTFSRVSGRIQAGPLEPIAVKGFSRPIAVYDVVSVTPPS